MRKLLRNSTVLTTLIASICAPVVALAGGGKNASPEEPKAQARQLWEAAITAKGGHERLRSISSLFVKADIGGAIIFTPCMFFRDTNLSIHTGHSRRELMS